MFAQASDVEDSEWVSRVERELRLSLFNLDAQHQTTSGVQIEGLHFDGTKPRTHVVVLFRDEMRLDCLRGYRWGNVWEWRDHDPEFLAHVLRANFEEGLLRISIDCDPDAITWVD